MKSMGIKAMESPPDRRHDHDDADGGRSAQLQQLLVQGGNLTGSEARVLVALLRLRTGTLKQLSETTGISRSNIYPVLESVSAKGLCRRLPGQNAVWECPGPKEVLGLLQRLEEARLQSVLEAASRSLALALTIFDDPSSATGDSPITVSDDARIMVLYSEAMASVEAEVLVLNRGPYPGDLEPDPTVLEAINRGVKARALYVAAELDAPDGQLRMSADAFARAGVDLRVVDSLPVAMAVVGEEMALLALPSRDGLSAVPVHAAAVRHEGMVELLSAAFDHLWEKARPYISGQAGGGLRMVDPETAPEHGAKEIQ